MEKKIISIDRSVTMPLDWWDAIEVAAEMEGMSVSMWVANCCRAWLPSDIELSEKKGKGRPRTRPVRATKEVMIPWRDTCNFCRRAPKPEGKSVCDACQKFIDWQKANPE